MILEQSNDLMARIYQVREVIHSTRINLQIMQAKPDHKKLYQWDKPHKTIKEENQEERFNKVYRPLLRRLLYLNRHDPSYEEKLRTKVENMLKQRNFIPTIKREDSERIAVNSSPQSVIVSTKSLNDLQKPSSSKYHEGSSSEQIISSSVAGVSEASRNYNQSSTSRDESVIFNLKTGTSSSLSLKNTLDADADTEIFQIVTEVVSKILTDVESMSSSLNLDGDINSASSAPVGQSADPQKSITTSTTSAELDINNISNPELLMELDPSDPKFTTMAEDLVKSCCEEPEGLIKTLEDLAKQNETASALGTNDSDLMNFLDDDDFMDSLDPAFDPKPSEDVKPSTSAAAQQFM